MGGVIIIAIYLRVSSEDLDLNENKTESDSIENQRYYIINYISCSNELSKTKIEEYCDDGYSGLNFERPEIKRLFDDIDKGKISCIIVKDLSRFGRNYIEVGKYLEQVFPLKGIRFISINNHYDSINKKFVYIESGIINLIYELYSRDLSVKIKNGKLISAQKGYYSGSIPPYGYKKSGHSLEIDEFSSRIVKKIFDMKEKGFNASEIAFYLNSEKIEPPMVYIKKMLNKKYNKKQNYWNTTTINRIIKNECYIGNTTRCKSEKQDIRSKRNKTEASKQITVKNTHSPIITYKQFYNVNKLYPRYLKKSYEFSLNAIFRKKIVCGSCEGTMTYKTRRNQKYPFYYCRNLNIIPKNECFKGCIYEEDLYKAVKYLLKIFNDMDFYKTNDLNNKDLYNLKLLENEYKNYKKKKITVFEMYSSEKISEQEYKKQNIDIQNKINSIQNYIIEAGKPNTDKNFNFLENLKPEIINYILVLIKVYNNMRIEILFNFKDVYI